MIFFHGYSPDTWDGLVKNGLIRENAGIRFCQSLEINEDLKFNNLAKKGSVLYELLKEKKFPLYIDRLQGGCYIENYPYDMELLEEYREMLGDKFWGFQMHEWVSNYSDEIHRKLGDISKEDWTEENIEKKIFDKYPGKHLFLESMTLKEMVAMGKPETFDELYHNITEIYKKRIKEKGELIPCDSGALAYQLELACGTKRVCPEVGAQTPNARIQICYARGMTRKAGRSFGVYYEPWGGNPFSTCSYFGAKNEWGIDENSDFPFKPFGPNGGSSRSLQNRIYLYAYLSNAEFISEEWGLYNTFSEGTDYMLSPYGDVKKDFLDFCDKYPDVGEKIVPAAVVIPEDMMFFDFYGKDDYLLGFENKSEKMNNARREVFEIFASATQGMGNENLTLKNFVYPDAIDILNRDDDMLCKYKYLIDLTTDEDFKEKYSNVLEVEDLKEKLNEVLPCNVYGNIHWIVNECTTGGFYLTVFNNDGIERSVEGGERVLEESCVTVPVRFKNGEKPTLLEGDADLIFDGDKYILTVKGGNFAFIKF